MAYALNTSVGSRKITLGSTGVYSGKIYNPTFQLSRPIVMDERLFHMVGLESVTFQHPTYFHTSYMTGTFGINGVNTAVTSANFNLYLQGLYLSDKTISVGLMNNVLYQLRKFFHGITTDDTIQFYFDGFNNPGDFLYNTDATALVDANTMAAAAAGSANSIMYGLLYSLPPRLFRFHIKNNSAVPYTMQGAYCALFGLDTEVVNTIAPGAIINVQLPAYGHDYIALASNIISSTVSSVNGERLGTSDLLTVCATPNYPGDTESYSPATSGGKVETASNIIDSIELRFTDELGTDVLSLENFIVTLVIDEVLTQPLVSEDHIRLDKLRKAQMEDVRKKLRVTQQR